MIVTLAEAKAHLGIEHNHQDVFLQSVVDAAEDACARYAGCDLPDEDIPPVLKRAVLMTVAAFYDGRETGDTPDEARILLADFRQWEFGA